jgi:TRAP-type C4-dicarboxylate transport system permease large subunit
MIFVFARPEFGEWTPSYGLASTLAGAILGAISASASARVAQSENADA